MSVIISGLLLGGTYALIAVGLTMQYGVSRIMNLANGENLVFACFVAFWLFTTFAINPILGIVLIVPLAPMPCDRWSTGQKTAASWRSIQSWRPLACCSFSRGS